MCMVRLVCTQWHHTESTEVCLSRIALNMQNFQSPRQMFDPTKGLDATRDFPTPTDISGTTPWFGLVNQGANAFAMTRQMKLFRHLLKPSTTFTWTDELNELFHKSKEIIIREKTLKSGLQSYMYIAKRTWARMQLPDTQPVNLHLPG